MAPVDWGRAKEAKEAQEVKESRPLALIPLAIATLLAILGSAAHGPTLLITPGYLVRAGGCPCTCAVPPSKTSASTPPNLLGPGLAAVDGPAREGSLTHSQAEVVKESLGSAAHSANLLMTPGYPVSAGG